jgi:hypothetical protein
MSTRDVIRTKLKCSEAVVLLDVDNTLLDDDRRSRTATLFEALTGMGSERRYMSILSTLSSVRSHLAAVPRCERPAIRKRLSKHYSIGAEYASNLRSFRITSLGPLGDRARSYLLFGNGMRFNASTRFFKGIL